MTTAKRPELVAFLSAQEEYLRSTGWTKDMSYPRDDYPFNRWLQATDKGYTQPAALERQLGLDGYYKELFRSTGEARVDESSSDAHAKASPYANPDHLHERVESSESK